MNTVNKIKPFKLSISQKFHEKTKIASARSIKNIPVEKWPKEWKKVYFKGYPRFKAVSLPKPELDGKVSLKKVFFGRQSWRNFSNNTMRKQTLSNLLYYTAGIRQNNPTYTANRFYPSAGSRYPLEVYPIIFNVEGIPAGLYHFYIKTHLLEILPMKSNFKSEALNYFGNQSWIKNSNLLLVISAVFYRNKVKYNERGYRHVLTEVGCLMQNIYLISTALNIGCCPTGGFVDDGYNSLLDLDGIEESVLGVIAVGEKSK